VVYWLAIDGPRAAAEARHEREIAAISQRIGPGNVRVGAVDLSDNEVLMLELQLDRPVFVRKPGAWPTGDDWLVSGRGSQPNGHYRMTAATGSFALSRREPEHRAPLAQ
jgi:hypothetical protein